jgi:hypothetical protein
MLSECLGESEDFNNQIKAYLACLFIPKNDGVLYLYKPVSLHPIWHPPSMPSASISLEAQCVSRWEPSLSSPREDAGTATASTRQWGGDKLWFADGLIPSYPGPCCCRIMGKCMVEKAWHGWRNFVRENSDPESWLALTAWHGSGRACWLMIFRCSCKQWWTFGRISQLDRHPGFKG